MNRNASSFVADVILTLISEIKDNRENHRLCTFWLRNLSKQSYGISRATKYRRLRELEKAGIIELATWEKGVAWGSGKCWIPTQEFHSKVIELLE